MEKGGKLMKLWDVVRDGQLTFGQVLALEDPVLKVRRQKTAKCLTFLRFFFNNIFPLHPLAISIALCFCTALRFLQFCFFCFVTLKLGNIAPKEFHIKLLM